MAEEDTSPLLGRRASGDGGEDVDDERVYKQAPSLARFLGALGQGRLPDNNQLYTLLHRAAAFLDGISTSVTSTLDGQGDDTDDDSIANDGILSDDTAMIIGTLLKESSALSRLLARWLYGEEAKEEQREKQKKGDEAQGARGNEKEQIQRLLWHLARAFSLDTALPLAVKVDVPVDVKQAGDSIQEGAKQVKEDTIASGRSIGKLLSLIIGSEE